MLSSRDAVGMLLRNVCLDLDSSLLFISKRHGRCSAPLLLCRSHARSSLSRLVWPVSDPRRRRRRRQCDVDSRFCSVVRCGCSSAQLSPPSVLPRCMFICSGNPPGCSLPGFFMSSSSSLLVLPRSRSLSFLPPSSVSFAPCK